VYRSWNLLLSFNPLLLFPSRQKQKRMYSSRYYLLVLDKRETASTKFRENSFSDSQVLTCGQTTNMAKQTDIFFAISPILRKEHVYANLSHEQCSQLQAVQPCK
jgi:hypothetical protein